MTGKWTYRIALAAVLLETTLMLVLWSRGEAGPILPLAMFPFAAASLVPSGLAALGILTAGHDRRQCLVAVVMTGLMAIPAVADLCVPLSNEGWEPELEPAGRLVFLVLPLQIPFGLGALFAGVVAMAGWSRQTAGGAGLQTTATRTMSALPVGVVATRRPPSSRGASRALPPGPLSPVRVF